MFIEGKTIHISVSLGRSLFSENCVFAEGIEDEIQSSILLSCGYDEFQGYYFACHLNLNKLYILLTLPPYKYLK